MAGFFSLVREAPNKYTKIRNFLVYLQLDMFLFGSKVSFLGADVLRGWTDWHSHILPGVDDGVRTLEEALAALAWYEEQGVQEVWLTPHIMEDMPNETGVLRERFAALCAAYSGPVGLHLAAEHMLDPLFAERLSAGDVLPYGDSGVLLVETSYFNPPMDLDGLLEEIRSKGFKPLLAHPERYVYMQMADYKRLASAGVAFQLNLPSLVGAYGEPVRRKALDLLCGGYYYRTGSDLHRLSHFSAAMQQKALPSKSLPSLSAIL